MVNFGKCNNFKRKKILFGKRIDINKWELIGGKIEPNEQPKEAIIREIKEELDASVDYIKLSTSYVVFLEENEKINILHITFIVTLNSEPKLNRECHSELKWIPLDELIMKLDDKNESKNFCFGTKKAIEDSINEIKKIW
ncbi:MAG: NUDIX hydrolase [Candidatus Aenigmatarchaeota archaeon]